MRLPRIDVCEEGGVVVASVQDDADIDIANAVVLGELLLEAVPNHVRGLVLDLRAVHYVDSAGVRMLYGLSRQLRTSRQSLGLWLSESSHLRRLIQITDLEEVTVVCADVRDCIGAICKRE